MNEEELKNYNIIRDGGAGFYREPRGLIEVWGKEAMQFLDGLISNDVKTLADGAQMAAAFPNAQGRLLAMVRVMRRGDKFLIVTEGATREKIFQNLFRFTFAGDFFAEDVSERYECFSLFGVDGIQKAEDRIIFGRECFVEKNAVENFKQGLNGLDAVEISDDLYEVIRIESGIPKYGVDMDETTIVPETGNADAISYNKGCYIGQEIIARIHFRGHVAKQLTGLILAAPPSLEGGAIQELTSSDGKNAGKITSLCYSPKLGKHIALAYVRYDYLAEGTELLLDEQKVMVKEIPFF